MLKTINIFVGGSTDKNISQPYYNAAIELGQKIIEESLNYFILKYNLK